MKVRAATNLSSFTVLSGIAGLLVLSMAGVASAQEVAPPANPQDEPAELGDVVVTGSRIPRPNLEQPTPVATVSNEAIETSGTQDLGAILAELPALSSSSTVRGNSDSFGDSGGLNFPNLRNLGSARTLTLIDGRRHVGGDAGNAAVDLNSIPAALVERVEVTTGGASAVYGSDAVTGVVNIILKNDFEGAEFEAQYGSSDRGVGQTWSANGTFGKNFYEGRANATVSLFYDHSDQVVARDISALKDIGTILNPDDTGPNDGIFDRILVPYLGSDLVDENGVIIGFDTATGALRPVTGFDANGNPVAQPPRLGENSAAFFQFNDHCDTCLFTEDWVVLIPETDRYGTNIRLSYDLTDNVRAYFDGKYVRSEIFDFVQPSFTFGDYVLEPDSAWITPEIQAALDTLSPTELPLIGRFNGDIGARINDITRETIRTVIGLDGTIETGLADFGFDLSYNYGETKNTFAGRGNSIPGNYAAAIDAVRDPVTNEIVCRSQTPGPDQTDEACVPYNPFSTTNSAQAIDYVSHESLRTHTITQEVASAIVNFDTSKFFELPGGPIGFAGGIEYRQETSANINDEFVKSGLSETAPQPDAFGGFHVFEVFGEFNAPILADAPFAYRLSVNGAYRYADYSTVGGAEAWSVGAIYAPVRDITFRGTFSSAVRAPNITEAFLPATAGFFSITDPCDVDEIDSDPDRAANCAAQGVPVGFQSNTNVSIDGESSGNPNLDAEEAETFTYGVVLQPRWLPGLSFTADYYDIQIDKAISLIAAQDIIDNCYDASGGPDDAFCALFTRGADDNIDFVNTTFVNAAALTTKGWDFELAYTADLDDIASTNPALAGLTGRLSGSLAANYLEELNFFAFANRPDEIDIEAGEIGDPEWSFKSRLTWDNGPLALTWETRYEGRVARFDVTPTPGINPAESVFPNHVPAQFYNDFVVRYRLTNGLWATDNVELFVGVNNAFDKKLPYGVSGNGASSSYELFGRQYFGGLRVRF